MPCPHGMPSPPTCIDCMYEGGVTPPPLPVAPEKAVSAPFRATYAGRCPCGAPIEVGEMIVRTDRDRYAHSGCVG